MKHELNEIREEQFAIARDYESKGSHEVAYIAYWFVLEKALKLLDIERRKKDLYQDICNWKEYLEGKLNTHPKNIQSFSLQESKSIPEVKVISELLGKLPVVTEIMNTQSKNGSTKWRDRRNAIAHSAKPFGSADKYLEYRDKVIEGIEELWHAIEEKQT